MEQQESADIPLPNNWTIRFTEDGKKLFVDHANKITTWIDPRDCLTKPQSFADCVGDELPYGWEVAFDENVGQYFINHNEGTNQIEDPRVQWRNLQEAMIRDYLKSAHENISAKENIVQLKHERLTLAEQELSHLNHVLQRINEKQSQYAQMAFINGSKNSLTSSSSSLYNKYDPDLLRAEIETARQRVMKLKMEEQHARHELRDKQRGVETLSRINQNMVEKPDGYSLNERNVLENELCSLKRTLTTTDEEKVNLLRSLARLREDIQGMEQKQLHRSTEFSNAFVPTEKATSSSQTDALESVHGSRVGALARAKLRYNELKCRLNQLQEQLMALNERMLPAQLEMDRDQINLLREKENLLRELKSVCQSDAPPDQQTKLKVKMHELEEDLRRALRLTSEEMTQRLQMHQQKSHLEEQIYETGLSLANLELQLRSLSASTLSTSSLSTASSRGSLASTSAQDLLYMTSTTGEWSPSGAAPSELLDVHRRVEQLVYPQQILHDGAKIGSLYDNRVVSPTMADVAAFDSSSLIMKLTSVNNDNNVSSDLRLHSSANNNADVILYRENSASSGTNTRSVSAAVSDESMAGDSGVYDGGQRGATSGASSYGGASSVSTAVAQLMVTLDYAANVNKLQVTLEKARNLNTLWANGKPAAVQIRGCLLPTAPGEEFTFRTDWFDEIDKPVFKRTFELNINLHRICNKILQLYVWGRRTPTTNKQEVHNGADCFGGSQLNLAEFNAQMMRSQWANVLSAQFIKVPPSEPGSSVSVNECDSRFFEDSQQHRKDVNRTGSAQWKTQLNTPVTRHLNTLKEESSDESTVISSQTSTLTRNLVQSAIEETFYEAQSENVSIQQGSDDADYRFRVMVNDDPTTSDDEEDDDDIASEELVQVQAEHLNVETCDKETNTDVSSTPTSGAPSTISKITVAMAVSSPNIQNRRLNRSDSDTSVALQRKEPFRRNVAERRSLRWKRLAQPTGVVHRHVSSAGESHDQKSVYSTRIEHRDEFRTSVDIELELHSTKFRLERQKEEIEALRKMKDCLENIKADGQTELPKWLSENEQLMRILNISEQKLTENSSQSKLLFAKASEEKRARHLVRKAAHHVQKLNEVKFQQPSTTGFSKKISSLMYTSPTVVSIVGVDDIISNLHSNDGK